MAESIEMWTRPATAPIPTVWDIFMGHKKNEASAGYAIKIQDIPPDRFEDVLNLMEMEYDTMEVISSCPSSIQVLKKPSVRKALRRLRSKILEQCVSLCAMMEDDKKQEIMGCLLCYVTSQSQPFPLESIEAYDQIMDIVTQVKIKVDKKYLFPEKPYFEDFGMCVAFKHYGMGISYQLLKGLEKIGSTFDIGGAMMTFSSKYSQKNAHKAGFTLLREMKYSDYVDEDGDQILPISNEYSIKFMCQKYSSSSR